MDFSYVYELLKTLPTYLYIYIHIHMHLTIFIWLYSYVVFGLHTKPIEKVMTEWSIRKIIPPIYLSYSLPFLSFLVMKTGKAETTFLIWYCTQTTILSTCSFKCHSKCISICSTLLFFSKNSTVKCWLLCLKKWAYVMLPRDPKTFITSTF